MVDWAEVGAALRRAPTSGRGSARCAHAPHRRHRQARRRRRGAAATARAGSVLAAGSRDGDLSRADEARALVGRAAASSAASTSSSTAPRPDSTRRRFEEVTEAGRRRGLGATVKGSFFVTQAAAPHLRESRGLVVMLEDVAAYQPWPSFAAHGAAKAAQAMLTRTLAKALAPESASAGSRPGPSRSSRATTRSGGPPRRRWGASARPTTWPARSSISRGAASSPARRSLSTEAGCCKPGRPAMRRPNAWMRQLSLHRSHLATRAPRRQASGCVHEGELTDGELIERVGTGDRDAFDELYRRYTRPVLGLALRRLGDRGRAEDALQDAFAAIWRSAASYDPARGQGGAVALHRRAQRDRRRRAQAAGAAGRGARRAVRARTARPSRPRRHGSRWRVHSALEQLPGARASGDRARVLGRALRRARSPSSCTSRSARSRRGRGARSRGWPTCSRRSMP